jgi:hypothetical protein
VATFFGELSKALILLNLVARDDLMTQMIAQKIIEVGGRGVLTELTLRLSCHSRSMLTCCGTLPATPWRPVESIRGRFRHSWAIARLRHGCLHRSSRQAHPKHLEQKNMRVRDTSASARGNV